jgi:large subunit ribosomal protein L10
MRSEKQFLVQAVCDMISESDYCYFVSYQGIKVKDFSEFRNQLAANGAACHVLKNTFIAKAAEKLEITGLEAAGLSGSTAMIYGKGDCSAVAKVVQEFGKKIEPLKTKGGYMDGAILSEAQVGALADLPAKPVLQAMLLGVLQAPARNFVTVLNAKVSTIVNVVNAYKNKLEENN